MEKPIFQFGNIVVVDGNRIGVIVKSWAGQSQYSHDVYIRVDNSIKTFVESDILHYIYDKEIDEDHQDLYM